MKLFIKIMAICIVFSYYTPQAFGIDNNPDTLVKQIIKSNLKKYQIPGASVAIYKDGRLYKYSFGVMSNKTKQPVSESTIFELGSITKSFSGVLLAKHVNNGSIHFDDSLGDYLNESTNSSSIKNITLLGLATHTSGLPYVIPNLAYNAGYSKANAKILNDFLTHWNNPSPSSLTMTYSNIGFSLLGMAIAKFNNKPLYDDMYQNILKPLNMTSSFFAVPVKDNSRYAQGYTADGVANRTPKGGLYPGSWAMKSSLNDMSKYMMAALILPDTPESIANAMKVAQSGYFKTNHNEEVGLGFTVIPLDNANIKQLLTLPPLTPSKHLPTPVKKIDKPQYLDNALIEKSGATNGFRSYIGMIPKQKIGIVILINRFVYQPGIVDHIGREILFSLQSNMGH